MLVRVYITSIEIGLVVNEAVDSGLLRLQRSFDGKNGILAIYDGEISKIGLVALSVFGVKFFPLDNYGEFKITCPHCGRRIEDDWILTSYTDEVLSGKNIKCDNEECGHQMANVEFIFN